MVDSLPQSAAGSLRLRTLVCTPAELPLVCTEYEELVKKQHEVQGVADADLIVLRHQAVVWQLVNVLFSEKPQMPASGEETYELCDIPKDSVEGPDHWGELFIRRANFSSWLQESVSHLVQEELTKLKGDKDLKEIFTYLTGRQLDEAVEKAIVRGDVRLSCLLSQAGGSPENRADVAGQLEVWATEGLDQSLIEAEHTSIFKLLAGKHFFIHTFLFRFVAVSHSNLSTCPTREECTALCIIGK